VFPRLDQTRTSGFKRRKTTLVEKEKAISHAANILGRTFEEVLIFMMLLVQPLHQIVLHVIFG
jgi:hypothetical protein